MPQSNRSSGRRSHQRRSTSSYQRRGVLNNNPRSPLQNILGAVPVTSMYSKGGVPTGAGGAQIDIAPNLDLATEILLRPVGSTRHSGPSVQGLLQEASMLSQPDQLQLITLLLQKVDGLIPGQANHHQEPIKRPLSRDRELRWLFENRSKYAGQWVVVEGDRLIAHGPNSREVFQAAKHAGIEIPFIVQVDPEDQLPFGGW